MLCFCSRGTEVWNASKLSLPFIIRESWSFVDTFSRLQNCWEAQPGKLKKWITICWGIWKSRNVVRHGDQRRTGLWVVRSSMKSLEEFQIANETPNQISSDHTTTWKPPPPGWFKVNVDGALFSKTKQSGIGVIVRDEEGNVIVACSRKLDLPLGALKIEAKALEAGVQFAEEVGLRNVVFEGDSLLVINVVPWCCRDSGIGSEYHPWCAVESPELQNI